ncbi:hypothetical protein Golax_014921 [Gossypium laxum]|uniref:Uncharacterized protein n=1 Tax=Gossypium laxum TaxID=34288 RepID=A0A7J8ZWD4_9ROSI|nr:hypothetical protein [Gossypium laxum]
MPRMKPMSRGRKKNFGGQYWRGQSTRSTRASGYRPQNHEAKTLNRTWTTCWFFLVVTGGICPRFATNTEQSPNGFRKEDLALSVDSRRVKFSSEAWPYGATDELARSLVRRRIEPTNSSPIGNNSIPRYSPSNMDMEAFMETTQEVVEADDAMALVGNNSRKRQRLENRSFSAREKSEKILVCYTSKREPSFPSQSITFPSFPANTRTITCLAHFVYEPLQTGLIAIDSMIPIGRGQR